MDSLTRLPLSGLIDFGWLKQAARALLVAEADTYHEEFLSLESRL